MSNSDDSNHDLECSPPLALDLSAAASNQYDGSSFCSDAVVGTTPQNTTDPMSHGM
jgi:hypothetical protein